ncbi:NrsF family protein [Erwinia sp. V71]|uniref:NrsF family protein n=1 Tax=Erwinia sp. V71 TaxID=3369424 RepID=UPI003F6139E3
MANHDALIAQLSRSVQPVKRPLSAGWRAISWLALALPSGAAASLLMQRTLTDWSQPGAGWVIIQLALTFTAGMLAISNAFRMSIAGRRPLGWQWFVPLVLAWLATTSVTIQPGTSPAEIAEGTHCYLFMLVVSLPMVVITLAYLRRTRTLFPLRSLAAAGAGVACMALTLLSLCHASHVSMHDLIMHTAATLTIVAATMLLGRRWVSLRRFSPETGR